MKEDITTTKVSFIAKYTEKQTFLRQCNIYVHQKVKTLRKQMVGLMSGPV